MSADAFNIRTGWLLVAGVALLILLELATLIGRKVLGVRVKTISMLLRDRRYHLTSVIYVFSGLLTHCFAVWRHATVVGSVAFWLVGVVLLVVNVWSWRRPVQTWPTWAVIASDPPLWLLVGALSGFVLFPQGA